MNIIFNMGVRVDRLRNLRNNVFSLSWWIIQGGTDALIRKVHAVVFSHVLVLLCLNQVRT